MGLNLLGSCLVPVLLRLHIFALTATGMGFFLAKWQIAEQPSTASTPTRCREKSRTEQDQRGERGGTDRARDGRAERGSDQGCSRRPQPSPIQTWRLWLAVPRQRDTVPISVIAPPSCEALGQARGWREAQCTKGINLTQSAITTIRRLPELHVSDALLHRDYCSRRQRV